MIGVKVRLFSQATPEEVELKLEEGSSMEVLLLRLRERVWRKSAGPRNELMTFLNNTDSMIVLLNGMGIFVLAGWKTILHEGDRVTFLPAMAGG
jgi:molybdopterin converting factor small subunit